MQNKTLKRQLKRYGKTQSIGKEHNGLFEVRIHSLPPDKKHELEVILHNFSATINSAQHKPDSMLAARRQCLDRLSDRVSKLSSPSPPSMQALDSAYASVSATGVTVPTVPSAFTRPDTVLYQQVHDTAFHGASSVPQPPDEAMILDRKKQEFIVQKLEQIFGNDPGTFGESNEADKSLKNVQYRPLVAPTAPVVNETSARPIDESVSIRRENIDSAGAQSDHISRTGNFLPRRSEANQYQQRLSPDQIRHLRHPGVASPIAEPGPQASHEWVYLNLLVNMAQLHTLNVTPECVRKAIYDSSTKLVLSDDGCKVRWRGFSQETGPSPDDLYKFAATPSADSPIPGSVEKLEQDGLGPSNERKDSVHEYSTSYLQDTTSPGRHQSSILNNAADSNLQYRPMFAPRKRRSARSHCGVKDDRSVGSDTTSSSMASCLAQAKMDNQSGPMIFLDRDPFFLDLSADFPDSDRLDRTLYGRLVEQPLGRHNGSTEMYKEPEKRSSYALPTASGEALRHGNSLHESIPFPSLTIYDDDPPSSPGNSTTGAEPVELEASGIGGIQLEDNFAIDVKMEQQPPSSHSVPPYEDRRASTISRPSNRVIPTHPPVPTPHLRHLLSARTTHLPPSPLPPPSYVYPAFSSSSYSSDSESDDDILNDVDSDSELEFRPLSLSPQMRMFLEGEVEASAPEEDDEDMEVEDDED